MNFSLPPRPQYQPPPRHTRRYNTSGYHAVDKARYVHANYRFIVSPDRSYHAQAANADVHLDWDSVLQVLVSAQTQAASCPICLSMPVAPRMARCGHIFCLPCLIRYMHSSDEEAPLPDKKPRWKKCPICWDSIYSSETRPVRWFRGQEGDLPYEGGDVVLRLVRREPGSTLALPRDGAETLNAGDDIPWYHVAEVADYARIMKGGEDYMSSQYDIEIEDLRRQEVEDELLFGDENTWSRKAIAAIKEAKQKIQGIGNPPDVPRQQISKERAGGSKAIGPETTEEGSVPDSNPAASDEAEEISEAMNALQVEAESDTKPQKARGKGAQNFKPSSDQPYYFYQALPHFYLSPLDIRILKASFNDYASFPATILPRVEHISTGHIVDDELRKRVKYLGHLPYGCEVSFLECDWRDVVVPEVLKQFRAETDRRRKRNRDKEAREEKDRIRAEKEEDEKRWESARRKRPSFGSAENAPFSAQDFQPLVSGAEPTAFDTGISSASPPRSSSRFGALASPSTSPPSGARTVWGTTAIPSSSSTLEAEFGLPNDGWKQGWEEELLAHQESEIIAQTVPGPSPGPSAGTREPSRQESLKELRLYLNRPCIKTPNIEPYTTRQ
ncbi:hypothetical protein N7468_009926 [Penicillium chermesinum]|uniref:RING-type domain-containing protein n=1 Tax=Penicillium chermesinum TaxID=63820 RepID=A0A9W9TBS7_9EURO|nr:uncharacterized protein N7468_009926 [Penicillium chermesinum]KAJ5216918.1 hypothetical protein N7468_009926 [Penicillium chermesinum]